MLNNFQHCMLNTIYGENMDVLISIIGQAVKEQNINLVNQLKTAKYTFEGPLHLGALAAGAKESELKILSNYALPIGAAFQIRDDNIGIFGSTAEIGKPAGSDLKEGKITLLISNTLKLARPADKQIILKLLGKSIINQKDLSTTRQIIKDSGAYSKTQKQAEKLVEQGQNALNQLKNKPQAKVDLLKSLADYIIERQY
jgi:geranylgeranyl diphosphate synthase, type I